MTERTIDLIDTYCGKCEFVKNDLDAEPCRSCIEDYNNGVTPPFFRVKKREPTTNYDRIRNMSVEEMAQLFVYCNDFHSFSTSNGTYDRFDEALKAEIEWLMKEVSDE